MEPQKGLREDLAPVGCTRDALWVRGWLSRGGFGDLVTLLPQCPFPALSPTQCMLIFIIGGLVILAYCSQASNERTYQEVVWAVCGKVPGVLCEVAIAVYTFGTCIAFLIIIGDQEDKSKCVPQGKKKTVAVPLAGRGEPDRPSCPHSHCCSGDGARGSWEQPLVHGPQVHHQHHCLPPHPASLHPQGDRLPKIRQVGGESPLGLGAEVDQRAPT